MSLSTVLALKIMGCDSVATVLGDVHRGDVVTVKDKAGYMWEVIALDDIPFGHKIAVAELNIGEDILKYGESLGVAAQTIITGDYVHTHNLASQHGGCDLHHEAYGIFEDNALLLKKLTGTAK
ncbi:MULTISPECIES: UxaA family hydrolase [Enterobacter]|uniref:UxaA family hydrolase n=1 Tax=Enterobacter TaxID=547 RepID=UPI001F35A63D|nr:UxaA family hydrolase [Enterobacter quasiroggenkampii]